AIRPGVQGLSRASGRLGRSEQELADVRGQHPRSLRQPQQPQCGVRVVQPGAYADRFKKVWGANVFEETETAYGDLAASIAEYEKTSEVNSFSSKYDDVLRGAATLTVREKRGLDLFNGKARGSKCHTSAADPASGKGRVTDFSYDNAGVPKNPQNKFYTLGAKYNPAGKDFVDPGLGGQLKKRSENGKFKVPSL